MFLTHDLVQIHPRRKDTLTPDVITAIEHVIKDLESEVGHSNFVDLRKAECKTYVHLFGVLNHRVYFVPDVSCRFVNI